MSTLYNLCTICDMIGTVCSQERMKRFCGTGKPKAALDLISPPLLCHSGCITTGRDLKSHRAATIAPASSGFGRCRPSL